MRLVPIFCLLGLAFAGCSPSPKLPPAVGLSYLSQKPLHLNVGRIEVVKQYKSSSTPPHVENDLPVPPVAMIQQWIQDRLLPVGKTGHAVVTIEEASVVETPLKGTKGFKGMFVVDQAEQYDAKISIKVEIFDDAGNVRGSAYARSQGTRSVGENYTLGDRRKVWIAMMERIMNILDEELEKNVRSYLSAYVS